MSSPLLLESVPEEGLFKVHEGFEYEIGRQGSGKWVRVPKGYVTDLCSVPMLMRPFLPMSGKAAKPALLYDWLTGLGDERAHAVFDETLRVAGVKPATRWLLVKGVKLWSAWSALRGA